jgi:hypothetical protein
MAGAISRTVVGTLACIALGFPAAVSAAPTNDDFAERILMQLGDADTISNEGAGIEAGEHLTDNDPMGLDCSEEGEASPDGVKSKSTLWWAFKGNGGPITVSTQNSGFDTVLAVYEVPTGAMVGCNDDIQPLDRSHEELGARVTSELVINSVAGREYAVQAGSCSPQQMCAPNTTTGNITLRVSPTPPNDDRADATPINAGAPVSATNNGATMQAGETAMCEQDPYAKTVWFSYTSTAYGTAVFSASGFDTVMAVYRGNSSTPMACNDDAISGELGPSQIPQLEPPGQPFDVTPGEYLIQVGGFYNTIFTPIAARNGQLSVQVLFNEDADVDDDGFDRDQDCDDFDSAVHPGAIEIPNNEVDENCDGVLAYDRDGDGHLAPPLGDDCDDANPAAYPGAAESPSNEVDENCDGIVIHDRDDDSHFAPPVGDDCNDLNPAAYPGAGEILNNAFDENCDGVFAYDNDGDGHLAAPGGDDCDDANAAVNPGAHEIRGNKIDENCDGRAAAAHPLKLSIQLRLAQVGFADVSQVKEVVVSSVPKDAMIEVVCRAGCPFQRKGPITVHQARGNLVVAHSFPIKVGSTLEVWVTKPEWIGYEKSFLVRRGKRQQERTHCISLHGRLIPCASK